MQSQKTIIYLSNSRLPDMDAASRRILNNAKCLRELGYRVVLVGLSEEKELQNFDAKGVIVNKAPRIYDGFEILCSPVPKSVKDWAYRLVNFRLIKNLFSIYSNVHYVFLYNYSSFVTLRTEFLRKKLQTKVVVDVTEWHGGSFKSLRGAVIALDSFVRMRFANKESDGTVAISDYLSNFYKKNNVLNLPPLVDVQDKIWNQTGNIDSFDDTKINLVYSGQMGKKDRIDYLVKSLSELDRDSRDIFCLHIAGCDEKAFLKEHPQCAASLKKINTVFYGFVAHQDSIRLIRSADYFVFFRVDDQKSRAGFPTKFVESVTCGTKIFTNKSSNIERFFGQNTGILLDDPSIEGIKKALLEIVQADVAQERKYVRKVNDVFDYRRYTDKFRSFLARIE